MTRKRLKSWDEKEVALYKDSTMIDVDVVKIFWKVVDQRGPETTKDGRKE